jgi:hypothetical protein
MRAEQHRVCKGSIRTRQSTRTEEGLMGVGDRAADDEDESAPLEADALCMRLGRPSWRG